MIDSGGFFLCPGMMILPDGEGCLQLDKIREEMRYRNGIGINCAESCFSILPLAFDIATFPVQVIVLTLLRFVTRSVRASREPWKFRSVSDGSDGYY